MTLDWQSLYASVLPFIPAEIAADLTLIGTFLVSLCAVVARFWQRPSAGSRWLILYRMINCIGMNSAQALKYNNNTTEDDRKK
ncbi:hypothetical protein AA102526_0457 [Asaia lannensis NBRC 102526]|nr:hypothetical protein AA102526_0457 [Asaia lannensis NBRC 102526]